MTTALAQEEVVPQLKSGVDPFPVYKASSKTCYIDSIVYTGPFIVFCVSFEKPIADKTYHLRPPNHAKSWRAYAGGGYRKPIRIRRVVTNNFLVATEVNDKGVKVPLEATISTSKTARIQCQFQFWRSDFREGKIELIENVEDLNIPNSTSIFFTSIRIRKNNYNHSVPPALEQFYHGNYEWSDLKTLKKMAIMVNSDEIKPVWTKVAPTSTTNLSPTSYNVRKYNEGKLYLDGIEETTTNTILRVRTYGKQYAIMSLYHNRKEGFVAQRGKEKIPMQTIKNVQVNEYLVKKEVKKGETLSLSQIDASFVLTFEVHFERLPKDWERFDLIESFKGESGQPFDFFDINNQ
ncbi:MAG: hypothetical protein ACRBFS_04590 [Aureispira sp.]